MLIYIFFSFFSRAPFERVQQAAPQRPRPRRHLSLPRVNTAAACPLVSLLDPHGPSPPAGMCSRTKGMTSYTRWDYKVVISKSVVRRSFVWGWRPVISEAWPALTQARPGQALRACLLKPDQVSELQTVDLGCYQAQHPSKIYQVVDCQLTKSCIFSCWYFPCSWVVLVEI